MKVSARALNRATLDRQMLLRREPLGIPDAVRRVVALQAQHPASPYLALWNRIDGFEPADLDAAFAERRVVKASLMRITLHAVHAGDYRTFREAMEPTLQAAGLDQRFRETAPTPADAEALLLEVLDHHREARTSAGFDDWLDRRFGAPVDPAVKRSFRGYSPLLHAPTGPPWSFGFRPSFVAAPEAPALANPEAAAAGLQTLVLRYLHGFGPATIADVAKFALVPRARVKKALAALAGDLATLEGPNGETLYDRPGAPLPDDETPAPPRLMAMWDSVLLSYDDRSRIIPPDYRRIVIRTNGDVLPTLLVDGYVAGVWRAVEGGIEATAFHPLSSDAWEGLAAEARALLALLASRDPDVYGRYGHWWNKLPGGEVRLLPGG